MELVERLYGVRGHLLAIFKLDRLDVYPSAARTAHQAIDNIACFVCQEKSYTTDREPDHFV
eukprot:6530305-Pyramimonas_sp.AAC.1